MIHVAQEPLADKSSDYVDLWSFFFKIPEPNRSECIRLCSTNWELFKAAKGSNSKHQAWAGGYLDHLLESFNLANVFFFALNSRRPLDFELSDAILVLFLHDLEKPWKSLPQYRREFHLHGGRKNEKAIWKFKLNKIDEYQIQLNERHLNALRYVEGEGRRYNPDRRVQSPLAAFVHMCDVWSARGWFDYPLSKDDPWKGACRGNAVLQFEDTMLTLVGKRRPRSLLELAVHLLSKIGINFKERHNPTDEKLKLLSAEFSACELCKSKSQG